MGMHVFHNAIRTSLAALVILAAACANEVHADGRGCEEGIIRLPDRNGTIEICSSMAAQVPKLSKQLADATKTLGDQKKQIAELTRLVKNLNSVGRDIDPARQERLLSSLSQELERSSRSGEDRTRRTLQDLSDKLDDIQQQLRTARASPAGAADIAIAMKGDVGDAIARLELASASRMVDSILDKLTQIESKVDSVKDDTAEMRRMLKQIASEIGQLGKQGGLIANPSGYSALYHNARILAQRGEIDLAMDSYQKLFKNSIQLADPLIDLVALLSRSYGKSGAKTVLDKNFKPTLPRASYLYAAQLLSEQPMKEISDLYWSDEKKFFEFPPLGTVYARAQYENARDDFEDIRFKMYGFGWLEWRMLSEINRNVKAGIQSGDYLAYFIDPVRGNADVESIRSLLNQFNAEFILKTTLPMYGGKENLNDPKIDLSKSPITLDFETSDFFIWDKLLDIEKPIKMCAGESSSEKCINLNSDSFRCKKNSDPWSVLRNCLVFEPWVLVARGPVAAVIGGIPIRSKKGWTPPLVKAHVTLDELLQSSCVSQIEYSTKDGRQVIVSERQIIATTRLPDPKNRLLKCRYDFQ